jgi:hypothetical protein
MATSAKVGGFISDEDMEKISSSYKPTPKGFVSDSDMAKIENSSGPSVLTSAVRKFTQSASGGLSDEIAGGVEAAGRMVGVKGAGGPMKDISIAEDGPTFSKEDLKKAYETGRNHERQSLIEDSKKNPGVSIASELLGGAVSPFNKLTKGMTVAKGAATLGGIYGFGSSDADSAAGIASDTALGAGAGLVLGKGLDKVGAAISPSIESGAYKISQPVPKINKDEILAAAKRLNIEVTPGMLDDSGFVERLESSLSKSPSYFGQNVAKKQKAVTDALSDTVQGLTKDATNLSPYQVGEKFKSGVTSKIVERLDPISAVFDEVSQNTKYIPVSDRSKNAIINNIKNTDTYSLTNGAGKPSQYVDMIYRLKNADQVKTTMTMLNADIRASDGAEKQVLNEIKSKLSTLEENSITRAAIQQAREAGMRESTGKKIGSEIVSDLRDARSQYRGLREDLTNLAENSRIKSNKGPSAFLDAVEAIPSERVQDKFFNVENNRSLINLQEKFPEQFDLLRQGKLKEIADASIDNSVNGQGKTSTQKFLNEVRNLNPEAKKMLFKDSGSIIDDISTVKQSLPRNFNPSGTASELGFKDAAIQNIKDIPTYLLYKGSASNLGKKIGSSIDGEGLNSLRDVTASTVKSLTNPTARLSADVVATKSYVLGPQKWVADGADKVSQHSDSISPEQIEKLKATKKGRELLIKASDLKPNSKAMDKLVGQINDLNGGN